LELELELDLESELKNRRNRVLWLLLSHRRLFEILDYEGGVGDNWLKMETTQSMMKKIVQIQLKHHLQGIVKKWYDLNCLDVVVVILMIGMDDDLLHVHAHGHVIFVGTMK